MKSMQCNKNNLNIPYFLPTVQCILFYLIYLYLCTRFQILNVILLFFFVWYLKFETPSSKLQNRFGNSDNNPITVCIKPRPAWIERLLFNQNQRQTPLQYLVLVPLPSSINNFSEIESDYLLIEDQISLRFEFHVINAIISVLL